MFKAVHGITALALTAACATLGAAPAPQPLAQALAATAPARYDDWRPGPGWDRDIEVRCGSVDYRYRMCQVDTGLGGSVRLVRQISKTPCREGSNWGWNRAGVWVNEGCEGVFRVQRRWAGGGGHHGGGDWRPGPGYETAIRVRCGSVDYHYRMCQVDTGRGSDVRIARQISKTRCVEGQNWGWNRAGIWVNGGCDAEFMVNRRWR
jgi:hypothetical protein